MKRREAKALGLSRYATGKPCKHGHFSERYTKSAQCLECLKIQNNVWREANPEKHAASMKKWWSANKELHNVRVKRWQNLNKDKIKGAAKLWVKNNPDKVKAKALRHRKNTQMHTRPELLKTLQHGLSEFLNGLPPAKNG